MFRIIKQFRLLLFVHGFGYVGQDVGKIHKKNTIDNLFLLNILGDHLIFFHQFAFNHLNLI